jgi:hypothetical protein
VSDPFFELKEEKEDRVKKMKTITPPSKHKAFRLWSLAFSKGARDTWSRGQGGGAAVLQVLKGNCL